MQSFKAESEDTIRARAHSYWEQEGQPDGRAEIHWQRAVEFTAIPDILPLKPDYSTMADLEDVSLIDGIGPKITELLEEAGVTTLQQIADMSNEELAELDAKLDLKGRSAREEWIVQANELIDGQMPRAKIDQAKAAAAM